MRNVLLAFLAVIAVLLPARAEDLSATLCSQEQALYEALQRKDIRKIQAMVDMGAWLVDGRGFATPAELALQINFLNYKTFAISEPRVMPLGSDSCLLRYKLRQSGSFQGKALPAQAYCTSAWVRKGGQWRATFHQESPAAP